jgi:hypothetical protein
MDTKLTLKLDKDVIEHAKRYAESRQKSLSKLIEAYLKILVINKENTAGDLVEVSSFVKSMRTGTSIPNNVDEKEDYRNYLAKKHQ